MNALATAPGVIATPGKYYIGAKEVMEYLDCKENKAYELIRQLRDELVKAGKLTPAYPIGKVPRKYFFERWHTQSSNASPNNIYIKGGKAQTRRCCCWHCDRTDYRTSCICLLLYGLHHRHGYEYRNCYELLLRSLGVFE